MSSDQKVEAWLNNNKQTQGSVKREGVEQMYTNVASVQGVLTMDSVRQ